MQLFNTWRSDPGKLFLADGLGACMTVLLIAGILMPFQKMVGMPRFVLGIFLLFGCTLALYSFSCFFFLKNNRRFFLKIIALANTLYAALTTFFVIFYFEKLTIFGLGYFVIELVIILGLVFLEMKLAYKSPTNEKAF